MNDFLARSSNIQPSRVVERAGKAVTETQASGQMSSQKDGKRTEHADVETQLSSAAEVAEAQAKIAALLSEVDGLTEPVDVGGLEKKISILLPRPNIIIPLPPASRDVVERAIQIAESIRASAVLALAAQGNLARDVAEGVLE